MWWRTSEASGERPFTGARFEAWIGVISGSEPLDSDSSLPGVNVRGFLRGIVTTFRLLFLRASFKSRACDLVLLMGTERLVIFVSSPVLTLAVAPLTVCCS